MGMFLFSNPADPDEIEEVFFKMDQEKIYIKDGVRWNREYTVPRAAIDTKVDPFDEQKFVKKTGQMRGTVGQIQDAAAELSDKREKALGKDPVKETFYKDWAAARKPGSVHPDLKKKQLQEKAKSLGVTLE